MQASPCAGSWERRGLGSSSRAVASEQPTQLGGGERAVNGKLQFEGSQQHHHLSGKAGGVALAGRRGGMEGRDETGQVHAQVGAAAIEVPGLAVLPTTVQGPVALGGGDGGRPP